LSSAATALAPLSEAAAMTFSAASRPSAASAPAPASFDRASSICTGTPLGKITSRASSGMEMPAAVNSFSTSRITADFTLSML
jgi:hypothetical protein